MANNLRLLRTRVGWTAEDTAREMGLSTSGYIKLERGERQLTENTIVKAAEAFGVSADKIIGRIAPSPYSTIDEPFWAEKPEPYYLPPNPREDQLEMPIYRTRNNEDGSFVIGAEAVAARIERPHLLQKTYDAYGFLVANDLMAPAYNPADEALVNPMDHIFGPADLILLGEVDAKGNGIARMGQLQGEKDQAWQILQHKTGDILSLPKERWRAHRIVGKFNRR